MLSGLWPPLVMAHFLLGTTLVWNAVVLHDRAGHTDTPGVLVVAPNLRASDACSVAAAAVVLVTGTIVTGAGPHGGDEHVKRLPFEVEDVARIHSLTVWAFLALTVVDAGRRSCRTGAPRQVVRRARSSWRW